jgi:RNA polymerase sigma-70 factor (ECF subfamily)
MGADDESAAAEHASRNVFAPTDVSREAARDGGRRARDTAPTFPHSSPPTAASAPSAAVNERGLAFEAIYEAHFAFVWRSLRLLGVPSDALEDVAQDTFDIVARQLSSFEGRSSLRTWLFAIAQRVAANHRRTVRRKLSVLSPLGESVSSNEPTPHAHAEALDAADVVQRFVAGLQPSWRAVFMLAVLEDLPGAEVAALLNLPVNTVYSRVHTLRDELREAFRRREVTR